MLGKTHMAVGVAVTLAATKPQTATELVLAVGVGALGALISDIDVGTSGSHEDADRITVLAIFTVLAVGALDYFFDAGIVDEIIMRGGYGKTVVGALLFIGICAFGKEQPHRSFMHSFLALILLGIALGMIWEKAPIYFAVGFLSHLATDIFNKREVRLLYPLEGGVALGLFHAHGAANNILFVLGTAASVWEAAYYLREMIIK